MKLSTIAQMNYDLCIGCGICKSICPTEAIKIILSKNLKKYIPITNKSKCIKCEQCINICPGYSVNFKHLNNKIFNKSANEPWIGIYKNCYIGFSQDYKIRKNASSGGIITSILIYALENKLIDGVLITRMNKNQAYKTQTILATNTEQIISGMGSKYCPVNISSGLDEILQKDGKYAVVGLPCHIHGIRKAQLVNKKLRDRIVFCIGLFCSHSVRYSGTEFLFKKYNIEKKEIQKISYRGNGWPGTFNIKLKNKEIKISYNYIWNTLFGPNFFTPYRCLTCIDQTNELADISVGDAWLKEIVASDKIGTSIIISRNSKGENLVKKVLNEGIIHISNIDKSLVIKSQYHSLYNKKMGFYPKTKILNRIKFNTPKYYKKIYKTSRLLLIPNMISIFNSIILNNKKNNKLFEFIPLKILRFYGALTYYIDTLTSKIVRGLKL